ncbi:MAG: glycosyltransferase family 39 protein [Candidatus Woesebacteria bacterium]
MKHVLFFCILAIATLIRFHGISRQMILIGDQGRDLFVARSLVQDGKIPLLGIPSSVPRFSQGPVYIYFLAFVYWISQGSILATGLLAAGFSVATIVAVYLLVGTYDDWQSATLSSFIVAFSPMLLLHARMPYHVNPIPFFIVIYLWQLVRFYRREKWSAFGAGLGFALVFQFELAAFPLLVLIPFVVLIQSNSFRIKAMWSKMHENLGIFLSVCIGICLGLIPQIIFDFTHGFIQLGGFMVWVGYKIVTALVPFTKNSFTDTSTPLKIKELVTLFASIFTQNGIQWDNIFWLVLISLSTVFILMQWRKQNPVILVSCVAFLLLSIGLLFHRVPSEAYMPLFVVPVSVVIANLLFKLSVSYRIPLLLVISLSVFLSFVTLKQHNYFLLSPFESDWNTYRFGPSLETQRLIVNVLYAMSENQCVVLGSTERDATFPTLYNHLEYLLAIDPRSNNTSGDCVPFLIDRPVYAKTHWDTIRIEEHTDLGAYWIASLRPKKIYARLY